MASMKEWEQWGYETSKPGMGSFYSPFAGTPEWSAWMHGVGRAQRERSEQLTAQSSKGEEAIQPTPAEAEIRADSKCANNEMLVYAVAETVPEHYKAALTPGKSYLTAPDGAEGFRFTADDGEEYFVSGEESVVLDGESWTRVESESPLGASAGTADGTEKYPHPDTYKQRAVTTENPKNAVGSAKAPLSCVPTGVLMELGVAMMEGARKYGRHNYRAAGIRTSVYFDAVMRHMIAWWEGEDLDADSGLSHITKAIATLVVLRDCQMNRRVADDRPPPMPDGWLTELHLRASALVEKYPAPRDPVTNKEQSK